MKRKNVYFDKAEARKLEKLASRRKHLSESQVVRYAINTLDADKLLNWFDDKG